MTSDDNGGPGWSPTRRNEQVPPSTAIETEATPDMKRLPAEPGSQRQSALPEGNPVEAPVASALDELRARAQAHAADGRTRADENTDAWWRSVADQAIRALAETGDVFDAYSLHEHGVPEPDHPARWGPRFLAAARAGVIVPAGYASSRRPKTAGSAVRVWRGAA
jgi:hypothetical protein